MIKVFYESDSFSIIAANHPTLGTRSLYCHHTNTQQFLPLLFTENETNFQKLFGVKNTSSYVKDAFHDYLIHQRQDAINPHRIGTKFAAHYELSINACESACPCLGCFEYL
ncbi:hypothetical protein FIS3754_18010 [Fischerella sp. NIES-3754]|nr:hypothetical protein FIS3754_18010 [Fischerella sp. NIES-3754]BCX08169.1 MAG: hypothetical protein KatS3mg066_2028 [Fischerella sp.]